MTITKINLSIKQSVLLRLIKNGESLEDASSKAGLCINLSKYFYQLPTFVFPLFLRQLYKV